jgi:hypothetical protein
MKASAPYYGPCTTTDFSSSIIVRAAGTRAPRPFDGLDDTRVERLSIVVTYRPGLPCSGPPWGWGIVTCYSNDDYESIRPP